MFGLIILIAIYIVLGFLLAFVSNLVMREDVMSVGTGVTILVVTGVINFIVSLALATSEDEADVIVGAIVSLVILGLGIKLLGHLPVAHSLIIAAVFTGLIEGALALLGG